MAGCEAHPSSLRLTADNVRDLLNLIRVIPA